MKTCPRCKLAKPLAEFYEFRKGYRYCKDCCAAMQRERIDRDPEGFRRVQRRSILKCKYGLTEEQHRAMMAAQGGVCAICGAPPDPKQGFKVDHDHETGRVRGLLCGNCNFGIGHFRDDPELIVRAIAYVRRTRRDQGPYAA